MIGSTQPVSEGDEFEIDGVEWVVDEVRDPEETDDLPDHAEPQCFLEEVGGDRVRQYTEQFLNYGSGVERL